MNNFTTLQKALKYARHFIVTLAAISFSQTISAQSIDFGKVHIGLIYPISTNGTKAYADTNIFSFHLLAGVSAEERSFSFAGFSNIVGNNASGFQFAGFSNHIRKASQGFLFAGFTNTYQQGDGFQFAGFSNIARAEVNGAQFAGFLNKSGDTKGTQFAGFSNIAGAVDGTQFAGFLNRSSNFDGAQFAGFSNITGNGSKGTQIAGFLNGAKNIKGTQIGGFINIAKKVSGAQIAGFINIADSSDTPIGIINIIKNGEKSIGVSTDENLTTLLSFRSGGRVLYGIIGAGYNFENTEEVYAMEAGFGGHLYLSNTFRINTEIATTRLESFKGGDYFKSSLRVLPALKLAKNVEIFGGPVLNYVLTNTEEGKALTTNYLHKFNNRNNYLEGFYIGYQSGIHFLF